MSLDDKLQDLADRLGVALVVLDRDLKPVAYSIHDNATRRGRLAQLLAESASPLTDALVKEHNLWAATRPVRLGDDGENGARVVLPLRHERQLVGYVYHVEDREPTADDLSALESAATEIGVLMALRISDLRHRTEHSKLLLSALLGDSPAGRRQAAETLVSEGLIEDVEHYSVLVCQAPDTLPRSLTRLAVEATLEFTARATTVKIAGAVLGLDGVVLFPRPVNRERLDRALFGPRLQDIVAGVGSVKPTLAGAVDSYREARLACRASRLDPQRYGKRVFWADLGLDRLLLQLPLERLTREDFPVAVQRLLASPHGVELAGTLEAYLECGGEIQGTARRLSVHRSTLYYRLDRIREIVGYDITDSALRLDLHAGLRIARLAGHWPKD
ncbi:transcriptional regulator [Sphaerisporangium krabiense]|uniref:PucR family transcriptional regulator n=1 Tax=Sphaerisporangium krabiense TaxID=763782 RepID=A0A7W8Z5S2_9ACTN|nr:helix-turn-helix domain-containing protein [Sphaerisporangium krabiense]MBB5627926.1 hypothetical protein [Sphaerisporangium krabiense]GII62086.1 transcriptional regulator [Sphaerisporangium krabiense]